jgi:hypothetical protein
MNAVKYPHIRLHRATSYKTLNLHKRQSENLKFHEVTFYLATASFFKSFYAFEFTSNNMSLLHVSLYWLSFHISEFGEIFR